MAALPKTVVELSVRCTNLANKDTLSKSDPFCVLSLKGKDEKWTEFGRTEVIADSLNPEWTTKFVLDYSFEERQDLRFDIYDSDSKKNPKDLKNHDFLGSVSATLGSIVAAKFFSAPVTGVSKKPGKIFISAEETTSNQDSIKMQFAASDLENKDGLFGKSDPYFTISKENVQKKIQVLVYKSEVIKNNLSPVWKPLDITVRELCNGDHVRKLKFDVYDWDSNGEHDHIGGFETDLKTLMDGNSSKFEVINPKKQKEKKKYKNSGVMILKKFTLERHPTFLGYIQGGTSMNFSVAVDFTASNGDVRHPTSLHYRNPSGENEYTTAIRAVGSIIEDYDTDKQFPGLGFGGRVPPRGEVSHEFYLNLQSPETGGNPYCAGVEGLLSAYFKALQNVSLYGPTNFAPVINHVARFANRYQDGSHYFVLLIITDGVITDMEETKTAIVNASNLPMSIIIVGVGRTDFGAMEELDSDKKLLRDSSGTGATRDIVQFVEMRKFVTQDGRGGFYWDKVALAKSVLAEVPNQVVDWMTKRGVKPMRS